MTHEDPTNPNELPQPKERLAHTFRSLKELVDHVAGRDLPPAPPETNALSEPVPFPFLAIVGQREMKLALLLGLINPAIGGVLLVGPRGTAKTTTVRSLLEILPQVPRSLCRYGCLPEDIETGGMDAVCPDCARKFAMGEPLAADDRVRLIELPLNARLEDVIGGIDENAAIHDRLRVRRGILAQADQNLLYIDEVNLLPAEIVDAILDAAAQGVYTVRRGPLSATYRARLVLIGSMNPEEGNLRPQIMDRFGLRVLVRGLEDPSERLEAYHRVQRFMTSPRALAAVFSEEMHAAAAEIQSARSRMAGVTIPVKLARQAIRNVQKLGIDSLRAEITLFEAARAHAAADNRQKVTANDLKIVAPMALRLRRSQFMQDYFTAQKIEEQEMMDCLEGLK